MYKITKYFTEECTSCKNITNILNKYNDIAEVFNIDCNAVPQSFLSKTGIMGVPTVILTYETKDTLREVGRFVGPKSDSQYKEWLESSIERDKKEHGKTVNS